MTHETKNVPELRFPEFNEEWEEKELGDISEKVKIKNTENKYTETFTNSAEYGIVSQREFFDKDISNKKNLYNYYIVKNDDFVYNSRISNYAPVGPINRNKLGKTGVMSPLYTVFKIIQCDKSFMEFYFKTTKWHKFMKLNGDSGARSDRFTIKNTLFNKMPIFMPLEIEQQKIGDFFSKLDHQIYLEEQKLEQLEAQKKGYMQKIFSQELRFKDDNGNDYPEWEERNFSDIFKVVSTKNHQIKSSEVLNEGSIPVVDQGQKKFLGYSDEKDKVIDNFHNIIVYGDHTTIVKYIDEPFIIGGDGVKLVTNKFESNLIYLYDLLQYFNVKPEGYKRHFSILKRKNMYLSNDLEEQQKIGDFFNDFDNLIEKQSQKIDLLKQRKQGFLQKMFV
ncbi:restriction endonuclease subunit S [Staphylococcus auricularis]|nr:restriction endonuclease subunit S [Staphylococcus auricularis]MCE5037567.1 restriction endonuclease subunit S [Staphylococcus auricularis]